MKIGFLGGSFDPVHFGHLIAAQDVLEQFHLDRLILVPAAQAPLKPNDVQSGVEDRLAMLRAATEWDKRLEISDYELRKGGISYTIDSVRPRIGQRGTTVEVTIKGSYLRDAQEIVVFKSVGVGLSDLAAAAMVWAARQRPSPTP